MDSSNSQHSLSQPTNSSSNPSSGSGSASGYSGSDSRTRSGSGGSISPSTENNVPEGDNSSSTMQMENSTTTTPEDHMDVNMEDSSTSTNPSTGKEKVNVDTGSSSSSSRREGKAEEIGLLVDLYNLHSKTGRYALITDGNDQREFYKFWIEEEGDYANMKELDEKINELHERFLKNMDKKNVDGPTDSVDVEIFRLSEWIWGAEIDSCDQESDDGQEEGVKDSSDVNVVDDGANADGSSQPKESWSIAKGKGSAAS